MMVSFFDRNQPPTNDTFQRALASPGFELHLGSPWLDVRASGDRVTITTPKGQQDFDYLILSTGLVTDPELRPELRHFAGKIARWSDRISAPASERNALVDDHPYLGPAFQFLAKNPLDQGALDGLFAFNYSGLISLGLSASALSGLKQALPRLVAGVCDQLFLDRQDEIVSAYLAYDEPEFNGFGQDAQVAA
jgi:hypothetical protein